MRKVFVFGSNLAGRHGRGAAKFAMQHYGAKYGVGEGRTGDAYALPTKDERLKTRSYAEIRESLYKLDEAARREADSFFVLTPVGCGLAGLDYRRMAKEINAISWSENVHLHLLWLDHIEENDQ